MELVGETVPGTTGSGSQRATALDHEPVDDAVKAEPVVELPGPGLARGGVAVFLGAARQADEVRHRVRGLVVEEFDDDVALGGVESSSAHGSNLQATTTCCRRASRRVVPPDRSVVPGFTSPTPGTG